MLLVPEHVVGHRREDPALGSKNGGAHSPPKTSVVFLQGSGEFHVLQTFSTQIPQVLLRYDGVGGTFQSLDEILNSIPFHILWPLVHLAGIFTPRHTTESLKMYTFDQLVRQSASQVANNRHNDRLPNPLLRLDRKCLLFGVGDL